MIGSGGQHTPEALGRSSCSSSSTEEKYGLRPRTIIKRLQHERGRQEVPKNRTRPKSRPAPLSKYRRKTANARERHRMKEINNAFESLRKVLPDALEVPAATSTMTKITTLRLAVSYIRALSDVLEDESDTDICSLQNSLQDTLEQSLQCSFHSTTPTSQVLVSTFPDNQLTPTTFSQQSLPQAPQLLGYFSSCSSFSASTSPSTGRGSLSSTSDLEELLSDDSSLLEDNLDVFHDIPTLCVADPLEILFEAEKDSLSFTAELCN